ncbi:MAG: hypothetical protein BWX89_01134 [candidate division TA06 bacterium ADurb.Bin131]|uniref:Uncharacterized protein n=1 Tax=candidate division TA06 bacterium ADurb.Bin131 TaxID=1852827 RepID=A0A1V6C7V5_UNCT6|nr:MAG: hypothetical protein BWX89_01134 [candidate division TA06 bacterium ADurb.Bin131]
MYFVNPSFIDSMAEFLIKSGVSKSGSPTERLIIFSPDAASSVAFLLMASVLEGFIVFALIEILSSIIFIPFLFIGNVVKE